MLDDAAPRGAFPPTRWSAVAAARSDDPAERRRGLEALAAAYWKPVYKWIRVRWNRSGEDARDLTQEFFARVIEKDFLAKFDPAKGRLRTFLRTCVDAMLKNDARDSRRLKRGGEAEIVSLQFESAESELQLAGIPASGRADEIFEKEWVRSVLALTLERLRAECESAGKTTQLRVFLRYDVEDDEPRPTYAEIAAESGIAATDVTNHLAWARREFRRLALETLRAMTASDEEFRREARDLFGLGQNGE
jgi:RNA polymerase sigma factor (sigma-70 family)